MVEANFDLAAANRWFAAECFNRAWVLIDQKTRSEEEDEEMIELALASAWHWSQREDKTAENISASYWQVARVYTLVGQVESARRYARLCLAVSQRDSVSAFYLGYAYEALARAESAAGNHSKAQEYIETARRIARDVRNLEEKELLLEDLDSIDA